MDLFTEDIKIPRERSKRRRRRRRVAGIGIGEVRGEEEPPLGVWLGTEFG